MNRRGTPRGDAPVADAAPRVDSVTTVTILSKPECHLCDVAVGVVDQVVGSLPDDIADGIRVEELSILDDEALYAQWWEKIPVVLIDGALHAHWRVGADRLRDALIDASGAR